MIPSASTPAAGPSPKTARTPAPTPARDPALDHQHQPQQSAQRHHRRTVPPLQARHGTGCGHRERQRHGEDQHQRNPSGGAIARVRALPSTAARGRTGTLGRPEAARSFPSSIRLPARILRQGRNSENNHQQRPQATSATMLQPSRPAAAGSRSDGALIGTSPARWIQRPAWIRFRRCHRPAGGRVEVGKHAVAHRTCPQSKQCAPPAHPPRVENIHRKIDRMQARLPGDPALERLSLTQAGGGSASAGSSAETGSVGTIRSGC